MKKLLIQRAMTGEGRFVRQTGFPRFGHVVLSVEPSSSGGLSFQWEVSPAQIPEMFRDAVCRGVSRMFEPGAKFAQYEPDGILIRVVGGSSHDTDSNEGSFEIAAMEAFVMALAPPPDEAAGLPGSSRGCPKCGGDANVVSKMLMLGKQSPREERAGARRPDQLASDECLPEALLAAPLQQFIQGCYCTRCGVGFVPDNLVKPAVVEEARKRAARRAERL